MNFREKLRLGNDQELVVLDFLRKCRIKVERQNDKKVTDIDLRLPDHKIRLDVKYLQTPFEKAKFFTGLHPKDCLTISKRHVNKYKQIQDESGEETWVCFYVNYKGLNYGMLWIKNDNLVTLVKKNKDFRPTIHVDANKCLNTFQFLNYLNRRKGNASKSRKIIS